MRPVRPLAWRGLSLGHRPLIRARVADGAALGQPHEPLAARSPVPNRAKVATRERDLQRERERLGGIPSGRERVGGVHTQQIPQRLRENQNSSPAELRPQPSVTPANIVSTGGAAAVLAARRAFSVARRQSPKLS